MYTNKPVVVKNLFEKEVHNTIAQFVDEYVPLLPLPSDHDIPSGPTKFKRRYSHNMPFFIEIHKQLEDYATDVFGEKVKASYSFLSLYEDKGQCPLHIDRPQCRYTIDYLISQENEKPWPIKISEQMTDEARDSIKTKHPTSKKEISNIIDAHSWTECLLKPNDAVCYSGTNSWHYRPSLSVGTASLIFFHFVPEDFDGSLE